MLTLILGANGSGKSRFAERLATHAPVGSLFYLATMRPHGTEGAERVARHRAQRAGLGFTTYELPQTLAPVPVSSKDTVLLEDVSNLLANVMFETDGDETSVLHDIFALEVRCAHLIAVTIDGLTPSPDFDAGTLRYLTALGTLNSALFSHADTVVALESGTPHVQKGVVPCV